MVWGLRFRVLGLGTRVLKSHMVESRVSIVGLTSMVRVSIPHLRA